MGTSNIFRPESIYEPVPFHVCSMGRYNNLPEAIAILGSGSITPAAWPANNLAVYMPISIPKAFTIARFMIANGSNITGNVDIGIYSDAGTRLLSTGSTVRANASAVQYIGVTDTVFQAGSYYLALVGSSTTGTYLRSTFSTALRARTFGVLEEQLGATTLPSSMTPVAYTRTAVFQFGFSQSDSL